MYQYKYNTILLKNKALYNYIYNFYVCYQTFIKIKTYI